jgi:hypothetical protein
MKYSPHINRFLSAPARALLLTPLLKFTLKSMRDKPQAQAAMTGPSEGIEMVRNMPDFMIDLLAEGLSYACGDDPVGYLFQGKATDTLLVQKFLLRKDAAVKWFKDTPTNQVVGQEQIQRDGATLICRKAKQRLEAGLFSEAKLLFLRATEIDATSKDAWSGLADALLDLGLTEEAALARIRANEISMT